MLSNLPVILLRESWLPQQKKGRTDERCSRWRVEESLEGMDFPSDLVFILQQASSLPETEMQVSILALHVNQHFVNAKIS